MSKAWMPLYVGDYLGDTSHLNQGQHGAYLLLLMHYWQKGSIPVKREACYCIASAMDEQSRSNVDAVLDEFFPDGSNGRIDLELERAEKSYEKRAGAAKKRWNGAKYEQSNSNGHALHEQSESQSESQEPIKTPPNLPAMSYATRIIQDLGMSDTFKNRVAVESAVKALIRKGQSPVAAYEFLFGSAKSAIDNGAAVDTFWFTEQRWPGGAGDRSKKRVSKREQEFAEALKHSREINGED